MVGIIVMLLAVSQRPDTADDFRSFYRGGALMAANENVYSHPFAFPDKNADVKFLPFIRLPGYAAILAPLSALPYRVARGVWMALLAVAILICVWLFPVGRERFALALSLSFPLAYSLVLGQDICLILLIALASVRLFSQEREFLAGLAASLIAIKISYLPAVGLIFLAKSRRGTVGISVGVFVQIVLSFVLAGPRWPMDYLAILRNPALDPEPRRMPNIRAVMASVSLPMAIAVIASIAVLAALWFVSKRVSFTDSMIAALPATLIVLPHCYVYDAVLLTPLLVVVVSPNSWQGIAALIGLSPLPYLLLLSDSPLALFAGSLSIVLITLAGMYQLYRMRNEAGYLAGKPKFAGTGNEPNKGLVPWISALRWFCPPRTGSSRGQRFAFVIERSTDWLRSLIQWN
jgi:hypothetical protein